MADLPAGPENLALYAEYLSRSLKSPQSIRNYISGLKTVHNLLGLDVSSFSSFPLQLTLRALDKTLRHFPQKKLAITIPLLRSLVGSTMPSEVGPIQAIVFRALCLLLFTTFLRISSVLPVSGHLFDHTRHLTPRDVLLGTETGWVVVKWAKAHQLASQAYPVQINSTSDKTLCPVTALGALLAIHPQLDGGAPLFFMPGGRGCLPLTISQAGVWLTRALNRAGMEANKFSFHSFRRGGTSLAFGTGLSLDELRLFGGWGSSAILSYVNRTAANQRVASRLAESLSATPNPPP